MAVAVVLACAVVMPASPAPMRVCADPENLPFTNDRGEGFENRLAELLARDLGTTVAYTWRRQRSDFLNMTLLARDCDIVMGYPTHVEQVATTQPYYRSSYMWVTRRSRRLRIRSYDDPALSRLRIGVQFSGDDASSPPAQALGRRGIAAGNLIGFIGISDEHASTPPWEIINAVARGDIDIAAAWGPMAGFFAARQQVPLALEPVSPQIDGRMPQAFDISMAIRPGDSRQLARLNRFIDERRATINALLDEYHVPRVPEPQP
jgi:mxaJ protein